MKKTINFKLFIYSVCLVVLAIGQHVLQQVFCAAAAAAATRTPFKPLGSDSSPLAIDIIKARGFTCEMYLIKSYNGMHSLTAYHLINPLADRANLNKYPVVIFHGITDDATKFIMRSSLSRPRKPILNSLDVIVEQPGDEALAFMLANNNFDVWLMDSRGVNMMNRSPSEDLNYMKAQKYWNYSLDEQILEDVPAQIDFVLEQTQSEKIIYIGYSESTFFMFALLTVSPEYEKKLAAYVALAPVTYVTHLTGAALLTTPIYFLPDTINSNYLPAPMADTLGVGFRRLCSLKFTSQFICSTIAKTVVGVSSTTGSPAYFENMLKSTSVRVIKHFAQLYFEKRFGKYNWGLQGNLERYNQVSPPNYELARIKLPTIILARGGHDFLSTPEDQQLLINQLGVKPYLDIYLPDYNHMDFHEAKDNVKRINLPIIKALVQILTIEGGTPWRSHEKPLVGVPIKVRQPDLVSTPEDGSKITNTEIKSKFHLFENLLEGLDYKQQLGQFSTIKGLFSPQDLIHNLGTNMDQWGTMMIDELPSVFDTLV